ncbi:YqeG family HAD IIIA-type phosphatase [Psychrobacillus sp.]|uniref:YqeG family HAD IIIA-type phosphatase n=1 Tax=Psychrobacillus sp. TaxID=1871623 RepID=UPI0028BE8DDB|nr:YqeG family HAD IIIA-type phosphatase [Psychrobacillus sp.]
MYSYFIPSEFVRSVFHITPETLKNKGVKGIITDLDNTLVEWDRPEATPKLIEWFAAMKEAGIQITIVSNNNEMRVQAFAEPLGIPFISRAKKPLGKAFSQARKEMSFRKEEVVVIGDQLLTDVLGGNIQKLHTILVIPVAKSDGFVTKFNRMVERRIFRYLDKKGQVTWEEED